MSIVVPPAVINGFIIPLASSVYHINHIFIGLIGTNLANELGHHPVGSDDMHDMIDGGP